jgi:hypothetical protein
LQVVQFDASAQRVEIEDVDVDEADAAEALVKAISGLVWAAETDLEVTL